MRFVLAAYDPPHFSSRHEVCPVVELAHYVLHAVREHENLEYPALQLAYNMACESRVCRERNFNIGEVKMVRQNRKLVMT
jgi:hypothetical protein